MCSLSFSKLTRCYKCCQNFGRVKIYFCKVIASSENVKLDRLRVAKLREAQKLSNNLRIIRVWGCKVDFSLCSGHQNSKLPCALRKVDAGSPSSVTSSRCGVATKVSRIPPSSTSTLKHRLSRDNYRSHALLRYATTTTLILSYAKFMKFSKLSVPDG